VLVVEVCKAQQVELARASASGSGAECSASSAAGLMHPTVSISEAPSVPGVDDDRAWLLDPSGPSQPLNPVRRSPNLTDPTLATPGGAFAVTSPVNQLKPPCHPTARVGLYQIWVFG